MASLTVGVCEGARKLVTGFQGVNREISRISPKFSFFFLPQRLARLVAAQGEPSPVFNLPPQAPSGHDQWNRD